MYSPLVCDRRLHKARKDGLVWRRLPRDRSIEISSKLERLRSDDEGRLLADGQLRRPMMQDEEEFVESERLVCKADFEYWFTRYCMMELDPGVTESGVGGIGPSVLLESQRRYILMCGRREEECYEELKRYKLTRGILAYFHKVRQVAATATARAMTLHRMIFWPGTRCLSSTLDDQRKDEIYKRDKVIIDGLPFWMRPRLATDVKDTELSFEPPTKSRISYQAENQVQGIGVGSQNDIAHLTEVALWKYPSQIEFSFTPSLPKALTTLCIQESTSNGRGDYWHEVTEAARHKRRGYEVYTYVFIPWWYNKLKYRDNPPSNWKIEDHTVKHAELVERTSPEFNDGKTVRLSIEQLYWWETERFRHTRNGQLSEFLTNYAATPEQSFQSRLNGALPPELIEELEFECRPGRPYDVNTVAAA